MRTTIPAIEIFVRHAGDCERKGDERWKRCKCRKQAIWNERRVEQKHRVEAIRSNLLSQVTAFSEGRVTIDMSPTRHTRLRLRTGRLVSVIVGRCLFGYKGALRWLVKPVRAERRHIALVARLNEGNNALKDLFVIPPVDNPRGLVASENDVRLQRGLRLRNLADFFNAVQTVARSVQTG